VSAGELNRKALDEGWGFSNVVSISEYLGESTVANPELLDPANQRRVILQAVKVNYVVHGVIKAKKSYGLHVEVDSVCDRHDQVFELLRTNPLRGSIHVSDLSDRYLQNPDDHLDDYRVGDRVKAAVREIDILDEKLALTFRKSTVNIPLSMRHHRLVCFGSIERYF
jgi:ribosomal protein S1